MKAAIKMDASLTMILTKNFKNQSQQMIEGFGWMGNDVTIIPDTEGKKLDYLLKNK